jgi:hypothetical protein
MHHKLREDERAVLSDLQRGVFLSTWNYSRILRPLLEGFPYFRRVLSSKTPYPSWILVARDTC